MDHLPPVESKLYLNIHMTNWNDHPVTLLCIQSLKSLSVSFSYTMNFPALLIKDSACSHVIENTLNDSNDLQAE